jgi:hypothetical protein
MKMGIGVSISGPSRASRGRYLDIDLMKSLGTLRGLYSTDTDIVVNAQNRVTRITDLSGNGFHINSSVNPPSYVAGGGQFGRDVARFAGIETIWTQVNTSVLLSRQFTMVVRTNRYSGTTHQCFIQAPTLAESHNLPTEATRWMYVRWWNGLDFKAGGTGGFARSSLGTHNQTNAWYTYAMTSVRSNSVVSGYVNGVKIAATATNNWTFDEGRRVAIGATNSNSDFAFSDAAVYNSVLTDAQIMEIHQNWSNK